MAEISAELDAAKKEEATKQFLMGGRNAGTQDATAERVVK